MRIESIAATPRAGAITRAGVSGVNEARRDAATALTAIEPPDDVLPEHLALVAALQDLVAAVDDFLARTNDLDDEAFTSEVQAAADLEALSRRVGTACQALDRRAADLAMTVDIRC